VTLLSSTALVKALVALSKPGLGTLSGEAGVLRPSRATRHHVSSRFKPGLRTCGVASPTLGRFDSGADCYWAGDRTSGRNPRPERASGRLQMRCKCLGVHARFAGRRRRLRRRVRIPRGHPTTRNWLESIRSGLPWVARARHRVLHLLRPRDGRDLTPCNSDARLHRRELLGGLIHEYGSRLSLRTLRGQDSSGFQVLTRVQIQS